ncbi:MAG TPA: Holliday junction resolvase RuvX [Ktedonobacterales bacterium]
MIIVALDIGAKRIGVATGDDEARIATPREVIPRRSNAAAIAAIARVLERTDAGQVVVGLPISFDGQLHAQARGVQAFAEQLRTRIGIPLVYQDETLSTVRAEDALRAAGVRPERIRERIDAAAAAVILQDYLDQCPPTNPPLAGDAPREAAGHGAMPAQDGPEETEEVRRI